MHAAEERFFLALYVYKAGWDYMHGPIYRKACLYVQRYMCMCLTETVYMFLCLWRKISGLWKRMQMFITLNVPEIYSSLWPADGSHASRESPHCNQSPTVLILYFATLHLSISRPFVWLPPSASHLLSLLEALSCGKMPDSILMP